MPIEIEVVHINHLIRPDAANDAAYVRELCEKYKLPRMFFVTEMDVDDASFRQVVEDLNDRYGKVIAPHFQPIRENEKLVGYVNVIKNAGRRYTGIGQREECEIPDYCKPNLESYREKLLEAVAEISDEYMERYFAGRGILCRRDPCGDAYRGYGRQDRSGCHGVERTGTGRCESSVRYRNDSSQVRTGENVQASTARLTRSTRRIMISRRQSPHMYSRRW